MKKVLLAILLGVFLLAGGTWAVGLALPANHVSTVRADFSAPPETLYAIITDFEAGPTWRPGVEAVEVFEEEGRTHYRETGELGTVHYVVEEQFPPHRIEARIADEDLPYGGTWTWELRRRGQGTQVTITEAGYVTSPMMRVMSKVFWSPTKTQEMYLQALGQKLGAEVTPQVVVVAES